MGLSRGRAASLQVGRAQLPKYFEDLKQFNFTGLEKAVIHNSNSCF